MAPLSFLAPAPLPQTASWAKMYLYTFLLHEKNFKPKKPSHDTVPLKARPLHLFVIKELIESS